MRYEKKLNIEKRSREEALELLQQDVELWQKFCLLPQKYREELILFYMGEQGLRTTYDTVFKHIFSPERNKERIEDFISSILGEPVKIVRVLQHEGIQMQEKGAFVIMDVVVQLADGRYLNVEMQKIGYRFPAERTDCYLADLVMRQYNDLKREKGRNFNFRNLSKVMSIVIMEQSSRPFRQKQDFYIHRGKVKYDSGIRLDGLFENIYVSLDTYKNIFH
ncbi:MAG: Rpn family recombination-promoting nuclease/putative transposase, partial [Eubacterium sp.]|nr:Rpn family recombination-promoting nuclease/putative transposase [Eubacterium sp.]